MPLAFLPPPPQWELLSPEEKIEHTRREVAVLGHSYSVAAANLGTTRHGIAGTINRSLATDNPIRSSSGLKNQKGVLNRGAAGGKRDALTKAANKARAKPKPKRKVPPRLAAFSRLPSELSLPPDAAPAKGEAWLPLPGSSPVAVEDHVTACRWPIGADLPFRFCNEPVAEGKVYCLHHSAVGYREPPPRKDNGRRNG